MDVRPEMLAVATERFATARDVDPEQVPALFEPMRARVEDSRWPRSTILRRAGAARRRTHTMVGALVAVAAGFATMFGFYALLNIGMTMGLAPVADGVAPPPRQSGFRLLPARAQHFDLVRWDCQVPERTGSEAPRGPRAIRDLRSRSTRHSLCARVSRLEMGRNISMTCPCRCGSARRLIRFRKLVQARTSYRYPHRVRR